jgi:hypothetical protein
MKSRGRVSQSSSLFSILTSVALIASIFQYVHVAQPQSAQAAGDGWQVQMMATGKKETYSTWPTSARLSRFASPGTTSFPSATASSTGASARTAIGSGEGVYSAFFNQTGITKVAFVDSSTTSLDPTDHTNYLIFDLVESTGSESFYAILKRLDTYISTCACQNNDTLWGSASVVNLTAGTNGYSGTLSASGGSAFKTNSGVTPTKFAVYGINRDSDNDQQTMVAYSGNLNSGKGDSWRVDNPLETFWSYWGGDFHSNAASQRIGTNYVQTTPGVPNLATWTGDVYLLAYSTPTAATIGSISISATPQKGVASTLSVTVSTSSIVRFFANGKRIANCKDRLTSGTSPNNVATCSWKPTVTGAQRITATATPTVQGVSAVSTTTLNLFVQRRSGTR